MTEAAARPRTIVHVVEATLAGVGRHVIDLSAGQAALGHDVHVVCNVLREDERFARGRLEHAHVTFHPMRIERNPSWADLTARRAIGRVLAAVMPDVVHAHSSKAGLLVRSLRRSSSQTIYTPHAIVTLNPQLSSAARRIAGLIERRLSERTDHIVAVARHELDHLHSIGIDPSRTHLVPNGIAPLRPRPARSRVREELGLPDDATVVGFVGRLVEQKNPAALLATLPNLGEDVHLAFVGDGHLAEELASRTPARFADRVHLLGDRDGHRAMFAFDCLAVPSRYESAPYVALEAADAGIPVVTATSLSGSDEWSGERVAPAPSVSAVEFAAAIQQGIAAGHRQRPGVVRTVDQMVAEVDALFGHCG